MDIWSPVISYFSISSIVMCKSSGNKMLTFYFFQQRRRKWFISITYVSNTMFTANLCDLRKSISLENENSLVFVEVEKLHTVSILT